MCITSCVTWQVQCRTCEAPCDAVSRTCTIVRRVRRGTWLESRWRGGFPCTARPCHDLTASISARSSGVSTPSESSCGPGRWPSGMSSGVAQWGPSRGGLDTVHKTMSVYSDLVQVYRPGFQMNVWESRLGAAGVKQCESFEARLFQDLSQPE